MREFFIGSLNALIGVVIVLMTLGVVVAAGSAFMGGFTTPDGQSVGGVIPGIAILVGGLIYVMFMGGFLYLGLGIYYNTKRMAEALENR